MALKKKINLKSIVLIASILLGGIFIVNWYLSNRLEAYLRDRLAQEVSDATNGFYKLSFKDLSVGLFSGELHIAGLELYPDSIRVKQLAEKDSLPKAYVKLHIDTIDFKGINLSWHFNYRRLNFRLFEVKSADILLISPNANQTTANKSDTTTNLVPFNLYETVSPFFDEVSVRKMSLADANIRYMVESDDNPGTYALKNIDFSLYGFKLNKESASSGKLLYSDDFEFIAAEPQIILSDRYFRLETNAVKLSTRDSIISVSKAHLIPQDSFWMKRKSVPDNYVDAKVDMIEIKGVGFRRDSALNYFKASTFTVSSPDITYFNVKESVKKVDVHKEGNEQDPAVMSWTLYDIISPLLYSVEIDRIGIENATLDYTLIDAGFTDNYTMERFDFEARHFIVNPVSQKSKRLWYSDNYVVNARSVRGNITSKNIKASLGSFRLNTTSGELYLSNIALDKLQEDDSKDYIQGTIDFVDLNGLVYNKGLSARNLIVSRPNITYHNLTERSEKPIVTPVGNRQGNLFDLFSPYADFLRVDNIRLNNADINYHNYLTGNTSRINNFNFYATRFLIDNYTRWHNKYFFTCGNFGFNFKNLDYYLLDESYRLQIAHGELSHIYRSLILDDVRLLAQPVRIKSGTYADLLLNRFEARNVDLDWLHKVKNITLGDIVIQSPQIYMVKKRSGIKTGSDVKSVSNEFTQLVQSISVYNIDVKDLNFGYESEGDESKTNMSIAHLLVDSTTWDINRLFRVGKFELQSPTLDIFTEEQIRGRNATHSMPASASIQLPAMLNSLSVGQIIIDNAKMNILKDKKPASLSFPHLLVSEVQWNPNDNVRLFSLSDLELPNPTIRVMFPEPAPKTLGADQEDNHKTIYDVLGRFADRFVVKKLNVTGADLDFLHSDDRKPLPKRLMGATNLLVEDLLVDAPKKQVDVNNVHFSAKNLYIPTKNEFYNIYVGNIDWIHKTRKLEVKDIHMASVYPKEQFAYKHPAHKDWFDVSVADIAIMGLDIPLYLEKKRIEADSLKVNDVVLQNFKNQKIEIQHNIMPLIYEEIHKLPPTLIKYVDVKNFSVIYEELSQQGKHPGQLSFMGMNGIIEGFTNVSTSPTHSMLLRANGRLMGTGAFTATWQMPVNRLYDRFVVEGKLSGFDLPELNRFITPMAPLEVNSGTVTDLVFTMDASSEGGHINMEMLYSGLNVKIYKDAESGTQRRFLTRLANNVLKTNNPDKKGKNPRAVSINIERDKYHSTFNYFWQLLQPAVVESVGVSQSKQNFAKKTSDFFQKVKRFFMPSRYKRKEKEVSDSKVDDRQNQNPDGE